MLKRLVVTLALCSVFSNAFAQTPGVQHDGISLRSLQSMTYVKGMPLAGDNSLESKRFLAMKDAAMSVGAQHGYVETMNQLREQINAESQAHDDLFAFKDLMRLAAPGEKSLYYLPPSVIEINEVTEGSADGSTMVVSGKYYEILKKERLVTSPPDWREYLLFDIPVDVAKPVGALLPKTPEEQASWSDWVAEGWEAGIQQAFAEMNARVRNLGSDYVGMVRYLRLVEANNIEPSFVASQHRGRVNEGNNLHTNQRTFAITSRAAFNGNDDQWVPLNLDPRGSYRTPDEIESINGTRR